MFKHPLAAAIALLILAAPATAQSGNCGNHDAIVAQLANKYGESRQNMGLNQDNSIVEIFASDTTGTWTILVTMPSGISCLVAAGQNWEVVAGDVAPSGSPA